MPTTQKQKEYQRAYYYANKQKCLDYQKTYRANPVNQKKKAAWMKEHAGKYWKAWKENNPEKAREHIEKWKAKNIKRWNEYMRNYRQSPKGKKVMRVANWKQIGIVDTDLPSLYDIYIQETNCWICGNEFKNSKDRHLDHDHETGEVRYICCRDCNIQLLANKQ